MNVVSRKTELVCDIDHRHRAALLRTKQNNHPGEILTKSCRNIISSPSKVITFFHNKNYFPSLLFG